MLVKNFKNFKKTAQIQAQILTRPISTILYIYACMSLCMYVCMYVRMYLGMYVQYFDEISITNVTQPGSYSLTLQLLSWLSHWCGTHNITSL